MRPSKRTRENSDWFATQVIEKKDPLQDLHLFQKTSSWGILLLVAHVVHEETYCMLYLLAIAIL